MAEKKKEESLDIRKMYLKQAVLPVEEFKKEYGVDSLRLNARAGGGA